MQTSRKTRRRKKSMINKVDVSSLKKGGKRTKKTAWSRDSRGRESSMRKSTYYIH